MKTFGRAAMLACLWAMAGCNLSPPSESRGGKDAAIDGVADKRLDDEGESADGSQARPSLRIVNDLSAECQGPGVFLEVEESAFSDQCLAPRGDADDLVRIPKDRGMFATRCTVTLDNVVDVKPQDDCRFNDTSKLPFKVDDQLTVKDLGNGSFELRRVRGDFVIPLTAAAASGGGTPYLTGARDGIHYVVYLQKTAVTVAKFKKFYRVEVFGEDSKNWEACKTHMPDHHPGLFACSTPARAAAIGSQSSTSTGGEPPPR